VVGATRVVTAATLTTAAATADAPVVGSAVLLSIRKNGTQQTTATIGAGTQSVLVTGLSISVAPGDLVTCVVTQGTHVGFIDVELS
jgi:hypothetical protein